MKVNLSYSVELDEVLGAVQRLYREAHQKFNHNYSTLTKVSPPSFALGHLESASRNIGSTQEALASFSAKLEEIQGILSGYQGLIQAQLEPQLPPPPATWPADTPTEAHPLGGDEAPEDDTETDEYED
jgi:hypothetical protein